MGQSELRSTAYHEAGHAVVASALGLSVMRIEIAVGGDDTRGETDIEGDDALALLDRLALCAAGLEAQQIFEAPAHELAGWGDFGKMMELLDEKDEEEGLRLRMAGYQRAHDLLLAHDAKVHRVAEALLSNFRIDAEEAARLLT
jgi:ATP-dependent Zn protease